MHPWSAIAWAWRVLRGHSLTFAVLFACGLLGTSVIALFRGLLRRLDAPWYACLLVPLIAVAFLAKKEIDWMPDPETRKKWARRVFFGSIAIAIALAWLRPPRPAEAPAAKPAPRVQTP